VPPEHGTEGGFGLRIGRTPALRITSLLLVAVLFIVALATGQQREGLPGTQREGLPGTQREGMAGTQHEGMAGTQRDGMPGTLRACNAWQRCAVRGAVPVHADGARCVHRSVLVGDPKSGTTLAVSRSEYLKAAWVAKGWAVDDAHAFTLAASNCTVTFDHADKHDLPSCLVRHEWNSNLRFNYVYGSGPKRNFPCNAVQSGTRFGWPNLPSVSAVHRCATSNVMYGQCPRDLNFVVTERDPRDATISACFWKLKELVPFKTSKTLPPHALATLERCVRAAYPKYSTWWAVRSDIFSPVLADPNVWVLPMTLDPVEHVLRLAKAMGLVEKDAIPGGELLEILVRAVNATSNATSPADARFVPVTLRAPGEHRRTYHDYGLANETISWMDQVQAALLRGAPSGGASKRISRAP
jgi:hypothetical protein